MDFPVEYVNGGHTVTITETGVKTVKGPDGPFVADFPETIDLKVTDYCTAGCWHCHESSTALGKHANVNDLWGMLERFPKGVELAIGGGNPMDWPDLIPFLTAAKNKFICNITVNGIHVKKYLHQLAMLQEYGLLNGIGLSAIGPSLDIYNFGYRFGTALQPQLRNVVGHIIPGLWGPDAIDAALAQLASKKVLPRLPHYLILGYKFHGRGNIELTPHRFQEINRNLSYLRERMPRFLHYARSRGIRISFDNLAVSQYDVKNFITDEAWDLLYFGDDGTRSMYIDAVKQESGCNSTAQERHYWRDIHPLDFFTTNLRH